MLEEDRVVGDRVCSAIGEQDMVAAPFMPPRIMYLEAIDRRVAWLVSQSGVNMAIAALMTE